MITNNSCFNRKILLCIDGESHTDRAIDWTIQIIQMTKAALTVLHIREMYLKKFYNEIYAQGRREYLAHVNNEIQKHALKTFLRFKHKAQKAGVAYKQKEETCEPQDDPLGIILKEFKNGDHDLIVVGGKRLTGITTIKSKNIPAKLAGRIKERALLIIRAS